MTSSLEGEGGHYGLTGRPIKNAKVPKKVRNGAQKSGMISVIMLSLLLNQLYSID